jgi:O-antigen ligase
MQSYLTIDYSQAWIATVHNKYLLVWAETGAIGLAAFLWFLASIIRTGWRGATSNDVMLGPLVAGFATGVAGVMAHMMVDIYHSRIHLQMLWLSAALITAMWGLSVSSDRDRAGPDTVESHGVSNLRR